ncbi:1-aminocyclopropane-1-carboxylate deaminase/D-cysteine desulfhydrase [Thalassotalea agarivorans]|uniref:1-aminocyclopropane-1-carboxylate deaminase n=1 Tax=Thalassotalea agarivorans TaxID=349064 RepID=A0A1I0G162_THASX|nr:pyridoxal-phosphate dependent enzyme [Thalassotalea agarivorans]SET64463.1 1-aminocyclopropane-1-carboxylate deaminase [Thalassotalea agarivorans]
MKPASPIQTLKHQLFSEKKLQVFIKRDDLIDPIISGNKWRKIKQNLHLARKNNKGILSFGGSYSNHIHALAFACHQHNIPSIGIIRGEQAYQSNYTLSWARHWQMQLQFVDRATYRLRHNDAYLKKLSEQYPDYMVVPEGGSNTLALDGVGDVISELRHQQSFDTLIVPVGSGGTLAGLVKADENQHKLIGICVLKGGNYLQGDIEKLAGKQYDNWRLMHDFHLGGYAKFSAQAYQQMCHFAATLNIPFEPVYSGKMLLALKQLVEQDYFPAGHKIMLIHTGGLQGLGGMLERGIITKAPIQLPDKPNFS